MDEMLVDSHCHLAGPEFSDDLDAVVARARGAGLVHALVVLGADDEAELRRGGDVARAWDAVRFSIGVHPHNAGRFAGVPAGVASPVERALDAQPLARALGETGLDYHYDLSPRETQRAVFRAQIRIARRRRLPLVIHSREAEDDTFHILTDERAAEVGGVFHCFTGDAALARRVLDLGFHVSLAGIVTFPRAIDLQAVARLVPIDRLLVETDSPYLAPVPHRGRRNEPAHVTRVAEVVAASRGMPVEAVAEATTENFRRLFNP